MREILHLFFSNDLAFDLRGFLECLSKVLIQMTIVDEPGVTNGAIRALIAHRLVRLPRPALLEIIQRGPDFERVSEADVGARGLHELAAAWRAEEIWMQAHGDLTAWRGEGIRAIPFGSLGYPMSLRSIADPPLILFVQGEEPEVAFGKPTIGIVGSRRGDAVGCGFAGEVAREFARRGGCVVSGLAVGIDGAAHRGALVQPQAGTTIAVLGSGHHSLYPAMHRPLAREILAAGGLIVSQFEPDTKPFPANFLNRNRVIAGLSHGVLVVQAATRSGALVTARSALDEGREVLVVPGGITDPLFGGSNRLLRAGATPITSLDDVFESFPVELKAPPVSFDTERVTVEQMPQGRGEERLLRALRSGKAEHLDALVTAIGPEIHTALLSLELSGEVVRLPGNYIQRIGAGRSEVLGEGTGNGKTPRKSGDFPTA